MAAIPLLDGSSASSEDGFDESEKLLSLNRQRKRPLLSANIRWVVLGCCLVGLTIGVSVGVAIIVVQCWEKPSTLSCLKQSSAPSPIAKDLDITYHTQHFNGSFLNENIYRQAASAEVDAAWEALGVNYRSVLIPAEIGKRVGLAPDQVQVNEKYGGGFPANVEGLHQLHCLNLLRQGLYYNIDYYREKGEGAFKNKDHILKKHVSHCLDIIRQQLMCTVDIGVLGQVWYKNEGDEYPKAFVDFNTNHVCRNYDDIRKWAEDRQLPDDVPEDYLQPPNPGDRIYNGVP
ncbi:hypothetical protein M409DRAFT_37860 [Zasmidium cellare ATCC 36951]|uniref:Tat pathway signal sequence n=1 Tax=Zasmidium cellare ATCC 36951 TaxID=1080233 RepID=A0A6A6C0G7_ZASCE|nr:uncharacterized protein M409DRAFT_37860 [Zasmidium cellare ATCC 36951]KAF2159758.1 hypothetical protein M409DRAFT_37860 [Zasmidium cellare ATCC 36951]